MFEDEVRKQGGLSRRRIRPLYITEGIAEHPGLPALLIMHTNVALHSALTHTKVTINIHRNNSCCEVESAQVSNC